MSTPDRFDLDISLAALSVFDISGGILFQEDFSPSISGLEKDYQKLSNDWLILMQDHYQACQKIEQEMEKLGVK